jgi:hypothetical protein
MKHRFLLIILILLGHFSLAHAKGLSPYPEQVIDSVVFWETGPLLSPYGEVVPPGHFFVEPFLFYFVTSNKYNNHWKEESVPNFNTFTNAYNISFGICPKVDVQIFPQFSYQSTQGQSATVFNDFSFNFDVQIIERDDTSPVPAVKLIIGEIFPTGKYQNLDPKKLRTDLGGLGSYETFAGVTFAKLFHFTGHHFLKVFFTPSYTYISPVHVRGFNAFGGGFGTKGKILGRNFYQTIFALEYSLTLNWILSLDIVGSYEDRVRFKGRKGVDCTGKVASVGIPPSAQISLAPCIEYMFKINMGIIAGSWFSVAGKNTDQFASAAIAYAYYY